MAPLRFGDPDTRSLQVVARDAERLVVELVTGGFFATPDAGDIQSFGAEIVLVSRAQGGFMGRIRLTEELAQREREVFLPRQFSNEANVQAPAETTGVELRLQLAALGLKPDAFVAGVGTGGTIMGVARTVRAHHPEARMHPLEPAESPTLTTGCKVGNHRLQGISDEFAPF